MVIFSVIAAALWSSVTLSVPSRARDLLKGSCHLVTVGLRQSYVAKAWNNELVQPNWNIRFDFVVHLLLIEHLQNKM